MCIYSIDRVFDSPEPSYHHTLRDTQIGHAYGPPWVHPTPNAAPEGIDCTHSHTDKHCKTLHAKAEGRAV